MRISLTVTLAGLVALPLALSRPCLAQTSTFDRGYEQGYEAENPNSVTPIPPIPSIPPIGSNDYQEGIKEGTERGQEDNGTDYQSGYDQGQQDQQDEDSSSMDDSGSGDDN